MELSLSEDRLENIKLQLSDTNQKLKDGMHLMDYFGQTLSNFSDLSFLQLKNVQII